METSPRRGDSRKHTKTGTVLYVYDVETYENKKYVTFSTNPPPTGVVRCAGVLQTVPLEEWLSKTEEVT